MSIESELKALKDIAAFHSFQAARVEPKSSIDKKRKLGELFVRFYAWAAGPYGLYDYCVNYGDPIGFCFNGFPPGDPNRTYYSGVIQIGHFTEFSHRYARARVIVATPVYIVHPSEIPKSISYSDYINISGYHEH